MSPRDADISARAVNSHNENPTLDALGKAHPHEPESVRTRCWNEIMTEGATGLASLASQTQSLSGARFARLRCSCSQGSTTYVPTYTYVGTDLRAYVRTCVHMYRCAYICSSVRTRAYVRLSVRARACMYVRNTYLCTYVRAYVLTYARTYVHTYVRTYVRTYIRTYVHTYVGTCVRNIRM